MDKRGVEEFGPHLSIETIMWAILCIATLVFLFIIFTQFVK
jgi:hypothetical protein